MIRTSPLMVLFQHNNLRSTEWAAIRRELTLALQKVDEQHASEGRSMPSLAPHVKLQIIQTSIFEVALRIVEYFQPGKEAANGDTTTAYRTGERDDPSLTHDLSRAVHDAVLSKKGKHEFSTILVGPLALLSFPNVSPEHLKAALSILAPKATGVPAPTRKANPGYHDLTVQDGLKKLMLVAARVDGKVFDVDETKWVAGIQGGIDGLRAQLVTALQSMGAGVTSTLEGASKSLYLTMESRRGVLEEEQKGPEDKKETS
jgi:ribosomal protein L10